MTNPATTELDARYGEEGVAPTPWSAVEEALTRAELYWLTSVRPEGGPHMTPLIGVFAGGVLHFSTGPEEAKARNIAANPAVLMSTGANTLHGGVDIAVEGIARRVTDDRRLAELATAWEAKYGAEWHFDVADGAFTHGDGAAVAHVFRIDTTRAYAFGKDPYSHTRYRFG
jgi:general stress protein 26